jgi:hypothetical protein
MIPAALVRKVHADLNARFDAQFEQLKSGRDFDPDALVDLSRLLKRRHELLPCRDALIRSVQDRQDPATGLILDQPEWVSWPKALAECTSTLRALGATLRHRVPKLDALAGEDALLAWMKDRNWAHPWGGAAGSGHMVAGALFALSDTGQLKQAALNRVFDHIDALRDDTWGVWAKGLFDEKRPDWPQLGGAFYFGMIYDRFCRPLDRPEGACRMLVEMQQRTTDGSFCFQEGRTWPFASTDHDSLYVLTRYSRLSASLREEVLPSLERYARYFVEQMGRPETYLVDYPIPKILAILRPIFTDPDDDLPHWDYEMYKWVL